jgi:hypothetical protein
MNGFADHGLDEDRFGEKGGSIVAAFDAFRKFPRMRLYKFTSGPLFHPQTRAYWPWGRIAYSVDT